MEWHVSVAFVDTCNDRYVVMKQIIESSDYSLFCLSTWHVLDLERKPVLPIIQS